MTSHQLYRHYSPDCGWQIITSFLFFFLVLFCILFSEKTYELWWDNPSHSCLNGKHILSNQEKYLPLEAHINIYIWLFINSPQGSIVEFGIFYFEEVSHVIHFLHLVNNDHQSSVNIPWIKQPTKMFVCKELNLFPLIANGWQLFTICGEPPKTFGKKWTVCHVRKVWQLW